MINITDALTTATEIMLLGMVLVFAFLSLLVLAIKLVHVVFGSTNQVTPANSQEPSAIDPDVIAAISVAVHQYRQSK